ncbi:MAG: peptide-methionine (R)-S-oxide reductase MsrB [bacterium]
MPDIKSDQYWKEKLSPEQYRILREQETEQPFTGELLHNKEAGRYACAACGQELFHSGKKYDSGSGWPSFYDVLEQGRIEFRDDCSMGQVRFEVVCKKCGSHLGHVFDDGPEPTGKRYCINSASLNFKK